MAKRLNRRFILDFGGGKNYMISEEFIRVEWNLQNVTNVVIFVNFSVLSLYLMPNDEIKLMKKKSIAELTMSNICAFW